MIESIHVQATVSYEFILKEYKLHAYAIRLLVEVVDVRCILLVANELSQTPGSIIEHSVSNRRKFDFMSTIQLFFSASGINHRRISSRLKPICSIHMILGSDDTHQLGQYSTFYRVLPTMSLEVKTTGSCRASCVIVDH